MADGETGLAGADDNRLNIARHAAPAAPCSLRCSSVVRHESIAVASRGSAVGIDDGAGRRASLE
jgi:hypothetical protein